MIIAVINQKGGSGKSITTSLLAKSFSDSGKPVLLVDCDPQGGLSVLFNCKKKKPGLFDILIQDCEPQEAIHATNVADNIKIIPADYRLDQVFSSADPYALEFVKDLTKHYVVVFDTPPTMQGFTRSAIIASTRILIPCEMSETAYDPTVYTVEQVRKLKKKPEIVVSGYKPPEEQRNAPARELAERYDKSFKKYIKGTIPRSLTAAKLATLKGRWTKKTREQIAHPLMRLYGVLK